jgi:poly-gamma-glutamate synthesis protein (capsule biosynthesis protein)
LISVLFLSFISGARAAEQLSAPGGGSESADTLVSLSAPGVSVAAVGDVMMGGAALPVILERGPDYPFDSTRSILQSADFTVANLEAPFGAGGKPFRKTYTFRVPPAFAPALASAGFDAFTLANNHILDYGTSTFFTTLRLLDSLGVAGFGAGPDRDSAEAGVRVVRNGWTAAFLGFSLTYPEQFWAGTGRPGTAFAVKERVASQIARAKGTADLVVVSFHWGKELHALPEPYQRDFAHTAVDAGADLVLGHHPHVLQGIELYRGKPIVYSLGNFVFGAKSASCRESMIFTARFDTSGFAGGDVLPLSVDYRRVLYQPRLLRGAERERLIRWLNTTSEKLNGGRQILLPSGAVATP